MNREIRKLRQSFHCAASGLRSCMKTERNFRIHLTAAAYVAAAAYLGRLDGVHWAILCLCFGVMMGAELMNTAIERLCDWKATGYDNMVREAKDIAAAAVFICALFCVVIGAVFFLWEGALWTVLAALREKIWLAGVFVLSLPAAFWFVFYYGRK